MLLHLGIRKDIQVANIRSASDVMTSTDLSIIIGVITLVLSIASSMFISGTRWGRVEEKVNTIEKRVANVDTLQVDMSVLKHDVAEIKGMFTMRLKDSS